MTSTGLGMDISGAPVNPAQLTNVSPSSLFSASPGHTVTAAHHAHSFKPSMQINPKSYLGTAFKEVKELKIQTQRGHKTYSNSDSSSKNLDSESSDLSYYSDTSDDLSTDPLSESDI